MLSVAWECMTNFFGGLGLAVSRINQAMGEMVDLFHLCTEGGEWGWHRVGRVTCIKPFSTIPSRHFYVGRAEAAVLAGECVKMLNAFDALIAHDMHTAPCIAAAGDLEVKSLFFLHMPQDTLFELPALSSATAVVVNSALTKKIIESQVGFAGGRQIDVVYMPPPVQPVREVDKKFRKKTRIVMFMRYQPYKDPSWIFPVLDKLYDMGYRFTVTLIGRYTDMLKDQLSIYPWITVKGHVSEEEKYALLREADLMLHAARLEGYGFTVLEAVASGTPAIVTTTTGCAEVLPGDKIDPGNPQQSLEVLSRYINNPGALEELLHRQLGSEIMKKTWRDVAVELLSKLGIKV